MERHTCPRRIEVGQHRDENQDTWRTGTTFAGFDNDDRFRHCSWCGSIEPELFLELVERGYVVGPTDKNYKAYLAEPLDEPERERRYGELPPVLRPAGPQVGKFYFQHLDEAQRHRFIELHNAKRMRLAVPGHFYRLPFFVRAEE